MIVAELDVVDIEVCGMFCIINGNNGVDNKLGPRDGLTCKPAASGAFDKLLEVEICVIDNTGAEVDVVTIVSLPELAVSVLIVVTGVTATDVVLDDTKAAKVGAVSDVIKIGCANFGRDAM